MASGHCSLQLSETVGWEEFPEFADELLKILGGHVLDKTEGVDMRIWEVSIHGHRLKLVYEDYPLSVAFESADDEGDRFLRELKQKLEAGSYRLSS